MPEDKLNRPQVQTVYTLTLRVLEEGCEGEDVKALQQLLTANGCATDPDGIFGPKTKTAVEKYQRKVDLTADGKAGVLTMGSLMGDLQQ